MSKILLICLLVFTSITLKAQNFQKVYSAVGSDKGHAIIQTSDGGYAIAGLTSSFGAGGGDFFLIKTNSTGNILWQKTIGSSSLEDGTSVAIAQTTDAGFVITGSTYGFGAGAGDCYIVKTDATGGVVWSNKYNTNTGLEHGRGVKIASNGDILIAGTDNQDNFGAADLLVLRINNGGSLIWSKVYGGGNNDHLHSIEELPGGNLIISGSTQSYGPGGTGGYILKTDASGNVLWDYSYGGSSADGFNASALTNNNEIILTGTTNSYGAGNYDVWVTKIDTNGLVLWSKTYGGPNYERGASINIIPNSTDYFIVANTESFGSGNKELLVIRINFNGDILWSKTFGTPSNEEFDSWSQFTITSTNDGGFAMTGWSNSPLIGGSGNEVLFIKSDGLGSALCEDALISVASPNITRNNPTSGEIYTGNYTSVSSVVTNSSFTELILNYCSTVPPVPPIADFSKPSTTICENDCVNFSDLSTGTNISSYSWSFPGAIPSNSTQQNPTNICYSSIGNYNVWLIVSDDNGSDTLFMSSYITVNPCNPPIANFTFPNPICLGDCIDFSDLSTSNTTDWEWEIQGGSTTNSSLQNPAGICFNTAGSFPITLTVSNVYGTSDTTLYIDVITAPSAGNDSSVSICITEADFLLTDLLNGATTSSGDWVETNSGQFVSTLFSPQNIGVGVFEYSYITTNNNCQDTSDFIITIENENNAGTGTTISYCQGANPFDLFTLLSGNPETGGVWSPVLNSGTSIYSPQIDQDGSYFYIISGACMNDSSEIIVETISLIQPILDVPDAICSTINDFYLLADIQGGTWTGIGVVNSNTGLFSSSGLNVGDYTITYTIDTLGCEISSQDVISISNLPDIEFINDFAWCFEDMLSFSVNATNANEFIWSTGDTTSVINLNFDQNDIGETYVYSVQAVNNCGIAQAEFSILIEVCEVFIYVPNSFTPNSDEFNNLFGPSLDGLAISEFQFDIYNRWGELIWQSLDPKVHWDGTYAGEICQDGIYTWVLKFSTTKQPNEVYRGHVNLLR